MKMHDMLSKTRSFQCSDPRDRIFSLLTMCKVDSDKMKPDYAKSVLEILEDATRFLIEDTGTIDVLLDTRLDRSRGSGYGPGIVPTWVPDFTCLQPLHTTRGKDNYCAGSDASHRDFIRADVVLPPAAPRLNTRTIPRTLEVKAILFGRIAEVTSLDKISYEHSPSGKLIYSGLLQPGAIVKHVLETLKFDFNGTRVDNLDRAPRIGRLMLEYLFEEQRNHLDEHDFMSGEQVNGQSYNRQNLLKLHEDQRAQDIAYASAENVLTHAELDCINAYWDSRNKMYDQKRNIIDVRKAVVSNQAPWAQAFEDESIRDDFKVAFDVENLFCYARTEQSKFYFAGRHYYRPMRANVLACNDVREVHQLITHDIEREGELESHEYSEKSRCREFFKTAGGFVGLGPATIEPDDILVIPISASRPLVLRHTDAGYQVIGEAILPGLMHGPWLKAHGQDAEYYALV